MKKINKMFFFSLLALALSGCLTIPNSPNPRFYAFTSINASQAIKKINLPSSMIIGIGPVTIPEYLDRPQIVTVTKEKTLQFAQFDRWGESLDLGLARLVREDLTAILPGTKLVLYPWNPLIAVKYQVTIEVVQLDSKLDKDMFLVAQWVIVDTQNSKTMIIKRSEFRRPIIPQNYFGLAKTLSTASASLSGQIAETLAGLAKYP